MTYRPLLPDEIETLRPEFVSRGTDLPDPEASFVMGAFVGSEICGWIVVQIQAHMEPFLVKDPHAFRGLFHATEKEMTSRVGTLDVFCSVHSARHGELAETIGFKPIRAYRKTLWAS